MRHATVVTVLSQWVAGLIRDEFAVEPRVLYPGVDLDEFRPGGSRSPHPTIFCAAAPDVGRKRVRLLVEAFQTLRRDEPEARLRLMRPHSPDLERTLSAVPGVELLEWGGSASVLADRYRSAWLSVLPSHGEAFGLVLIESLACGTPAIGVDRDAFPEIIDRPSVGRLFDEQLEGDLVRALKEGLELAAAPGTVEACRRRASDFSMDRATGSYAALYRELLGDRY